MLSGPAFARRLIVFLLLASTCGVARLPASTKEDQAKEQRQAAPKLFAEIADAPEVELLTIDPNDRLFGKKLADEIPKKPRVDGYLVKTRATTRDRQQIKALALSLRRGIEQSDGDPALSFDPHLVLRVPRPSGDMLVVVAFKSQQGYVTNFTGLDNFTTTSSPEAEWQKIYAANGL